MLLKTSFFHKGVARKNCARFAPLWAAYLACWIVLIPMELLSYGHSNTYQARQILEMGLQFGSVLHLFYGLVTALALFSHLYSTRSIYTIAALPVSRETMFSTQYLTGILFCLVPQVINLLVSLVASFVTSAGVSLAILQMFAMNLLTYVFFFSFAVFIAMLTGHILALPVLYAILNFTVVVLEMIIRSIGEAFLYGMSASGYTLSAFSPLVHILDELRIVTLFTDDTMHTIRTYTFEGWNYLLGLAAVGLIFAIVAFFLHRHRHMESAGDVIAISSLRPVFKYCITVGCSLCLGILLAAVIFSGWSDSIGLYPIPMVLCLLVGGLIGYFSAEMLLQKSFRVWKLKNWIGYGIFAAMMVLCCFLAEKDIMGFESKIPELDSIESVHLSTRAVSTLVEDEEYITDLLVWHQSLIQDKQQQEAMLLQDRNRNYDRSWVTITYMLKNGSELHRNYALPALPSETDDPNSPLRRLDAIVNSPDFILLGMDDLFHYAPSQMTVCNLYGYQEPNTHFSEELTTHQGFELLHNCIYPDILAGTLGRSEIYYLYEEPQTIAVADVEKAEHVRVTTAPSESTITNVSVEFWFEVGGDSHSVYHDFEITPEAVHTWGYLEKLGLV